MKTMSKCLITGAVLAILALQCGAVRAASMIGYWENWNTLTLGSVSSNYDIIDLAFAIPSGTDGATITWSQSVESSSQFLSDVKAKQAAGKKVILSIGGADAPNVNLSNSTDISNFVSSVESIVNANGLNGIDLDLENGSLNLNSGDNDFTNPTTPHVKNLITALNDLHGYYGSNFLVSYASETNDVDAYGSYGGGNGDYLPVIYAYRANSQIVQTQMYDSGTMYARNGQIVTEATPDFDVALSEELLLGYRLGNGQNFPALSQNQVAFGVPATSGAADSYDPPSTVLQAAECLGSGTSYGGSYTREGGPYPNFAGVMTWDIDYDWGAGYALANTLHPYLAGIGGSGGGGGGGGGSIANGVHYMAPACATGSRLDDTNGSTSNGNHLQIWSGGNSNTNQAWNFALVSGSVYNMAVKGPYCLDSGGTSTNGGPATIWTCNGNSNQSWTATPVSGGYTFKDGNAGLCLDVSGAGSANGTVVDTWACNGTNAQTWAMDSN